MADEQDASRKPRFAWWTTKAQALAIGCTHHARFMGIVPGFVEPEDMLWVPRSELLIPLEDALVWCWMTLRNLRGEEPDFMFAIGKEIDRGR